MTQVKQKVFELLQNISDEKVIYIIKFIQAIKEDSKTDSENNIIMQNEERNNDLEKRQAAFDGFMQYAGRLSSDFDYKNRLAEYREKKNFL